MKKSDAMRELMVKIAILAAECQARGATMGHSAYGCTLGQLENECRLLMDRYEADGK